jgi:hypothetical protein
VELQIIDLNSRRGHQSKYPKLLSGCKRLAMMDAETSFESYSNNLEH